MLCEASSIIKAIESVWKQSGKPTEFSIKILEEGEKGFLWFTKSPAIISMSYDPKKQTEKEVVVKKKEQNDPKQGQQNQSKKQLKQNTSAVRPTQEHKKEQRDNRQPQQVQQVTPKQQTQLQPKQQATEQKLTDQPTATAWTDEQIADISQWLQETFAILNSDTKFSTAVEKRTLRVTIDRYPIADAEENKTLYISLGNLFMQALKKKHKKKFQGFNIIITLKDAPQNGNQKSLDVD